MAFVRSWLTSRSRDQRLILVTALAGIAVSLTVAGMTLARTHTECSQHYYYSGMGVEDQYAARPDEWYPCDPEREVATGSQVFSSDRFGQTGISILTRGGEFKWGKFMERFLIGLLLTGLLCGIIAGAIWVRRARPSTPS